MRRWAIIGGFVLALAWSLAWAAGPKVEGEEAEVGKVRVSCDVAGATVSLAGLSFTAKAGAATVIGDVPVGRHQVTAVKEGLPEWRGEVEVKAGQVSQVAIKMAPAAPPAPSAEAKPKVEQAEAAPAAKPTEPAPAAPKVEQPVAAPVAAPAAKPMESAQAQPAPAPPAGPAEAKKEAAPSDKDKAVQVRKAAPGKGRVTVTSNVSGAVFRLAGVQHATREDKPLVIANVPVGVHDLTVELPGYETWTGQIKVTANKTTQVAIDMAKLPPPLPRNLVNSIGMKLVLIPAGQFLMGSPAGDGFNDERPARTVLISKPFYMGVYEVTQLDYQKVMGENPAFYRETVSDFRGVVARPVERVDWEAAAKFCVRLSSLEGKTYRLPTEAEWEYACRAGGEPIGPLGVQGNETSPEPGPANPWGLIGMRGNVWEWCADWYDDKYYATGETLDPKGPAQGKLRIARGGSFISENRDKGSTRSNFRGKFPPFDRDKTIGFRVVMEP